MRLEIPVQQQPQCLYLPGHKLVDISRLKGVLPLTLNAFFFSSVTISLTETWFGFPRLLASRSQIPLGCASGLIP